MGTIFFIEKNVHGAWVIFGRLGVRQYYGYTKREACEKYKEEFNKTIFDAKAEGGGAR